MWRLDRVAVVAVLLAIALFGLHVWQFTDYIADDAAITFAYAKNLARGNGLVLNRGTDPVEGYSNFAWLLVVLPFCARGTDPTCPVKTISFVLGAATLILVALVAEHLASDSRTDGHRWSSGGAALGLAAFTPYAVWASAGMENVLYGALFVGALLLYLRRCWLACALALFALSLTRVEGVGIAALFAVHRAGGLGVDRARPSRAEIAAALTFLLLYGAYSGWHWWYFRAFLPNTYLAKSPTVNAGVGIGSIMATVGRGWAYARDQLIAPYRLVMVTPFVIAGLVRLKPRLMTLMLLLIAGVSGLVLMTGGDFYPQFRLGTLFLPLWFLLLSEGIRVAVARLRPPIAAVLAILPLLVVCQPSIAVARTWGRGPIGMAGLKLILADRYRLIGQRIRKSPMTVLESDIGNVAYFTDFAILDLGGLANLHVAKYGLGSPFFLHYVFEEMRPDVIHLRDTWAASANIPIPLIERDYQRIEGQPVGPFADGWYLLRDRDFPYGPMQYVSAGPRGERHHVDALGVLWTEAGGGRWTRDVVQPNLATAAAMPRGSLEALLTTFAPHDAGAAAISTQVRRLCIERPADCHADASLSTRAQSRAEEHRRASRFEEAFNWYGAAFDADHRNIVALRGREDMRLAAARPCAPRPPADVHFSISGASVTVRWAPSAEPVISYVVEAGASSGLSDLAQLRSRTASITVPGVAAGTYFVRVKAENACGSSEASKELLIAVR